MMHLPEKVWLISETRYLFFLKKGDQRVSVILDVSDKKSVPKLKRYVSQEDYFGAMNLAEGDPSCTELYNGNYRIHWDFGSGVFRAVGKIIPKQTPA